jgi:internalin A
MTYQAALQKIEQARAEQWEELDLSGMGLTEVPPEIGGGQSFKRSITVITKSASFLTQSGS